GDQDHGVELWKSDGTVAGTILAADINQGVNGSHPEYSSSPGPFIYVDATHTLYFFADNGTTTALFGLNTTTGTLSQLTSNEDGIVEAEGTSLIYVPAPDGPFGSLYFGI